MWHDSRRIRCAVATISDILWETERNALFTLDELLEVINKLGCRTVVEKSEPAFGALVVEWTLQLEGIIGVASDVALMATLNPLNRVDTRVARAKFH